MPPKKKLSKKEKAAIEAAEAEARRLEAEKERLEQLELERERQIVEREEARKRQMQEFIENRLRKIQLKDSSHYFTEIQQMIATIYAQAQQQHEWDKFMRCNGLPDARVPADLRKYLHIWHQSIAQQGRADLNWLLTTSEQSVLTQDQAVVNLSRESMKAKQPVLGETYAKRIEEVLWILNEVQSTIDSNDNQQTVAEEYRLKQHIIDDLASLKFDFRKVLSHYIDGFSYKVLCNIERDMDLDGLSNAHYEFSSRVLKTQLFTIRIIPEPLLNPKERQREDARHTEIDFKLLGVHITLPAAIKCNASPVRGQWLNYDHLSDACSTFDLPPLDRLMIKYQKTYDLRHMTRKEWKKRKEMLKQVLEQTQRQQEEEQNVTNVPEEDRPKPIVIDVDKIYNDYEDQLNEMRRQKIGPDSLNLQKYDINLRRHRITGGIYMIDYLEQPEQDVQIGKKALLRNLVFPNALRRKPFFQQYYPPPAPPPGVRRSPEELEAEIKHMEECLDKLTLITIQLPDNVFWFEQPIVCRWESSEEKGISDKLDEAHEAEEARKAAIKAAEEERQRLAEAAAAVVDPDSEPPEEIIEDEVTEPLSPSVPAVPPCVLALIARTKKRIIRKREHRLMMKHLADVRTIEDFDLYQITMSRANLTVLLRDFVLPKLPEQYGIRLKGGEAENVDDAVPPVPGKLGKIIYETQAPRNLHPLCLHKHKDKRVDKVLKIHSSTHHSSNTSSANGDSSSEEEQGPSDLMPKYMFSEFLADLDELNEQLIPQNAAKLEEIVTKLEEPSPVPPSEHSDHDSDDYRLNFSLTQDLQDSDTLTREEAEKQSATEGLDEFSSSESESDVSSDDQDVQITVESVDEPTKKTTLQPTGDEKKSILDGRWSTRDIHDVKFNEDKYIIQFRAGRLGTFGFAANRLSNFPYQTWELRPDIKGDPNSVIFSFTAAVLTLELTITSGGVSLNLLQGGPTSALQQLIGVQLTLTELIRQMRNACANIFPEADTFCYVEGSCEKNYVMEHHLYACMATLALTHNFGWSRWNIMAGSRTAVILMREIIEGRKLPPHATLMVTPLKTCIIDCSDVSPTFNRTPVAGMAYYADLHHLAVEHSLPVSRIKQNTMCPKLRENVGQLLKAIRPLSFS